MNGNHTFQFYPFWVLHVWYKLAGQARCRPKDQILFDIGKEVYDLIFSQENVCDAKQVGALAPTCNKMVCKETNNAKFTYRRFHSSADCL